MRYTFRSESELETIVSDYKEMPDKVVDNARYNISLVEECFEEGACGNFYIITDEDGINSIDYKECLDKDNLDVDNYEFDDLICVEKDFEWHIRAYIGTEAYWGFIYRTGTGK